MNMKINIHNNKYLVSLITTWVLSTLVLAGCYYLFHLPKKEMLKQVRRQYDESNELAAIANKAVQQDTQEQIIQRCRTADQMIARFAVPQENTTGLVFEIGKVAGELGLSEFASKNPKAQYHSTLPKDTDVTEAWLELEFKTSFIKFAQYVNRLERQKPTVFIEKMALRKTDDNPREIEVRMELSFLVTQNKKSSVAMADISAN